MFEALFQPLLHIHFVQISEEICDKKNNKQVNISNSEDLENNKDIIYRYIVSFH